jgi:hypothetical protein
MHSLKEVCDEHFKHVKFDSRLAKAVYQYQIGYVNSNHEHLQFFGSNLLGVHVIRFKDSDVNRFYDEVLNVDYLKLTEDIRKLDTIDHTWKVSGDILNLTLMYVIHRFLTVDTLTPAVKERAAYDTALIFFYRCVAALISYFFKYPSDPKIAQSAYANLSNKFLIKKLGSWHKVMDYRAHDLISKSAIHYKKLLTFTEDGATIYAISDAQGRIRDLIKNYYTVFESVRVNGETIATTSGTYFDADGEETVKEKTKSVEAYVAYMRNTVNDKRTFLKEELIGIVLQINANTSFRIVKNTIAWMCDNAGNTKYIKLIDEFISLTIVQSMFMIQNNMEQRHSRDYPFILVSLKNLYLSTRTTDPEIDRIRELGLKIIHEANGKGISDALALSTRTSVVLYLSLRALVGQSGNN